MKTGEKVRIIKELDYGIVTFEIGDILTVANYIHKHKLFLKADGITDLISIDYSKIEDFIEFVNVEPNTLFDECLSRDWGVSLTWSKSSDWSVEISVGIGSKYKTMFYTDGHTKKETAIAEALEYFKG